MLRSQCAGGGARVGSSLVVNDLCAQLAPMNRYGLPGLSAAIVSGLRAVTGVSRNAAQTALCCHRA